jgi:hypothetical protein
MATAETVEFIKKVQLAQKPAHPELSQLCAASFPDNCKGAYVDKGSIVSFTDRLKGQQKHDVLNSTLFCQLAADYQYKRDDFENWYRYYVKIMGKLGYVIQNFSFTEFSAKGDSFTMDAVVLDVLAALATQDEAAVMKSTISAFKALSNDDGRIVLFDQNSKHYKNGNFQIFPCTVDSNNDVIITLGAFYFKSQQDGTDFLFWSYSSSSTYLYKGAQRCILNMDVYDQIRDLINKKLGDQAKTDINNIPI